MPLKWFQLIQALPGHPEIARENLAIAFLVGAVRTSLERRTTLPEIGRRELFNLLTSFVDDTPKEHVVSIIRCAHIQQPVVRLLPSGYRSPHGLDSIKQGRRTVLLDSEFATGQTSVSGLTEQLFQELGKAICEGRFSFRSGDYHFFNNDELDFIKGSTSL
jgi:hypothetical protein